MMEEKEKLENAMKSDPVIENHVIMSIPGIGPVTGSVILGKICDYINQRAKKEVKAIN